MEIDDKQIEEMVEQWFTKTAQSIRDESGPVEERIKELELTKR